MALKQAVGVERNDPLLLKSVSLPPAATPKELLSAYASIVKGFVGRPEMHEVNLFAKLREVGDGRLRVHGVADPHPVPPVDAVEPDAGCKCRKRASAATAPPS